jgi:broad specificity phosphatase PhoE
MKQVEVRRHANYTPPDELSSDGEHTCRALSESIGTLALVYSSPTNRGRRTAEIVSGRPPMVDPRAGIPNLPEDQREHIRDLQQVNPLGIVGVLWSDPTLRALAREAGERLVSLIRQVLAELQDGERALVISHDGTMVAAEQLLSGSDFEIVDHTYKELAGYTVDEKLRVQKLPTGNA